MLIPPSDLSSRPRHTSDAFCYGFVESRCWGTLASIDRRHGRSRCSTEALVDRLHVRCATERRAGASPSIPLACSVCGGEACAPGLDDGTSLSLSLSLSLSFLRHVYATSCSLCCSFIRRVMFCVQGVSASVWYHPERGGLGHLVPPSLVCG